MEDISYQYYEDELLLGRIELYTIIGKILYYN